MSPRTGRPKIDRPKDIRIAARLDETTVQKLDEAAKRLNESRSDVVRRGIEKVYDEVKEK